MPVNGSIRGQTSTSSTCGHSVHSQTSPSSTCGHSVHSQPHPHFGGTHESCEIPLSSEPRAQSGQCYCLWTAHYSNTFDNFQFSHLQLPFSTFTSITCICHLIYSLGATCCRTDKSWFDHPQRRKDFFSPKRPQCL